MSTGITINLDFENYVYVGHAEGQFVNEKGEKQSYYNIYVLSPVSSYESEDYSAYGFKAEKMKCSSAKVWEGLEIGDPIKLYFDSKNRVAICQSDDVFD